jgi:beta-glucanase (GH16 family)
MDAPPPVVQPRRFQLTFLSSGATVEAECATIVRWLDRSPSSTTRAHHKGRTAVKRNTCVCLLVATFAGLPLGCAEPKDVVAGGAPVEAIRPSAAGQPPAGIEAPICMTLRRGTAGAVADSFVASLGAADDGPDRSYGDASRLLTGTVNGSTRQSLLRFDLGLVPPGAFITSATVTLAQPLGNPAPVSVRVHRVLSPWAEDAVTWNEFGAAFDPSVLTSFKSRTSAGAISFDVTALVASWVGGALANDGILLERSGAGITGFSSSEQAVVTSRPRLEVCYLTGPCAGKAGGAACDDGNACTLVDTCQAGACIGSVPVVCAPEGACHVAGACDPATGACSTPASPDGTPCSDGDGCTQGDTCHEGSCVGAPLACTGAAPGDAGACDPVAGKCSGGPQGGAGACGSGGLELTFHDDFTSDTSLVAPNSPWITGYFWGQTITGELEYYTRYDKSFNTSCNKGGLNHFFDGTSMGLVAKVEPGNYEMWHFDPNYSTCDPYTYTSGMVHSKDPYLYGYFEIRARIPHDGTVFWPAFWLYSGNGGYREIDVFEFGTNTPNLWGMNMHIEPALEGGYVHTNHDLSAPFNNNYPTNHVIPGASVSAGFHKYAARWTPNVVAWYLDDVQIAIIKGHSPPRDMYIIANHAIHSWAPLPDNATDFPASFDIDYIRAYRSLNKEFLWEWGNGGSGQLDYWVMSSPDQFLVGDFDGDGRSDLLAISAASGHAHLMSYANGAWATLWGNAGSHVIDFWTLSPGDRFAVGDFDGDGRADLLATSTTSGHAHLMSYGPAGWTTKWFNGANHLIDFWFLSPDDQFVAGDFDGDGRADLLATSAASGYANLMSYGPSGWTTKWFNGGNHHIDFWFLSPGDQLVAGDFDGDGRAELLATSAASGFAHLMKYAGGWSTPWLNGGDQHIHWWTLSPGDRLLVGDADSDGRDDLLAISAGGWAHLMAYAGADWCTPWSNEGSSTIHSWKIAPQDRFLLGRWQAGSGAKILARSQTGWAHILGYSPMPAHP